MKTTEAVTSGIPPATHVGLAARMGGLEARPRDLQPQGQPPPWFWLVGRGSCLRPRSSWVSRTAEAPDRLPPYSARRLCACLIHAGDLTRILREKGMDEKKAVDPARKTARERLVARYEAGPDCASRLDAFQWCWRRQARQEPLDRAADSSGTPRTRPGAL